MAARPPRNRPVLSAYERNAKQTINLAIRHPSRRRHPDRATGGVSRPWIPTRKRVSRPADGMRLLGAVDGRGNVLSIGTPAMAPKGAPCREPPAIFTR